MNMLQEPSDEALRDLGDLVIIETSHMIKSALHLHSTVLPTSPRSLDEGEMTKSDNFLLS